MTSSFILGLDTQTHVAASINGGNSTVGVPTITLGLTADPDAIEVKVWGDIDPLDPANADYGETEGDVDWIPYSASFIVVTTANDGPKTMHVRVRDDVWNEATAQDSISLSTGAVVEPPPPVSQYPPTTHQLPEPHRPERHVRSVSRVHVTTRRTRRGTRHIRLERPSRVSVTHRMGARNREVIGATSIHRLNTSVRSNAALGISSRVRITSASRLARRGDGPETEAIVDLLL